MPDARTHDLITVATVVGASPFLYAVPRISTGDIIVLSGAYLLSGLLFSCDLDLHSAPYLRWGRLRFLWWPYQKFIHHRSVLSHGLIIGPVLRIIYFTVELYLLLFGGLLLLNLITPISTSGTILDVTRDIGGYIARHAELSAYSLLGFILGGAAHTIADVIQTFFKRRIDALKRRHRRHTA